MKKLLLVVPLVVLLLSLTVAIGGAGIGFEDPALCVNGKWLLVDAAHPAAIKVVTPEGARYGDQNAGHCQPLAPPVPLITSVKEGHSKHVMKVSVDGKQASTPTIQVSYGDVVQVKRNNGKVVEFTFQVKENHDD